MQFRTGVLLLIAGAFAFGFADVSQAQRYSVFPNSSVRPVYDNDLAIMGCQDLWVARNEIYHRNGYCFKTRRGRAFFDNRGCWTSNARLSRLENQNVARIKVWERRLGCR